MKTSIHLYAAFYVTDFGRTLESELIVSSTLVDQLLEAVERYGQIETSLRQMVRLVQRDLHEDVDEARLTRLEADIAFLLLQLGLQQADSKQESFSWSRSREAAAVNWRKLGEGLAFYSRGCQLMGQDVQLMVSMLLRAVVQGYTLSAREFKLLRRIGKDLLTLIPFVIILIIPLSPLGHVLVFSFIQRFFPDFFPSQFTESRQNIMSMYSSITASSDAAAVTIAPLFSRSGDGDAAVDPVDENSKEEATEAATDEEVDVAQTEDAEVESSAR